MVGRAVVSGCRGLLATACSVGRRTCGPAVQPCVMCLHPPHSCGGKCRRDVGAKHCRRWGVTAVTPQRGIVRFTGFWLRSASFVLLLVRVGSGARPFAVLRVRCFRWDSASITERCYCAVIPVAIRVTTMGTRVNLARSGRKALVTKFVGSACYLRRTTPRASGWFFCSQISTVIGSISYVRCNTPIALEERPRLHVA